jgi:tetratricopeptide (TPR) repeat protein
MENYYEALGVAENASADDIKKAYRLLAKKFHPDTPNGDDAQFRRVNSAYKVLSDPEARNDYDKTLRHRRNGTSSFDSYMADYYELRGNQIEKVLQELVRQGRLTRVKIKSQGKVLLDMPFTTATAITLLGFTFAPFLMLLVNVGINRFFEMEVTNSVMETYEKAHQAHTRGAVGEAETLYKQVIEASEFFVPAHLNLGMLYRQRGENQQAIQCFKKVLELTPFGQLADIARENLESLRGF